MPQESGQLDLMGGSAKAQPLAARMRPRNLAEYIGQEHLVAPGGILHQCMQNNHLHSMILWGPPGTGKTTLAHILAQGVGAVAETISAVTAGVKDIRHLVEQAEVRRMQGTSTVVFVDEVHRFSKSQQDAFLPHVEDGLLILIGATTANPSFEVNGALLSRARVHVLYQLSPEHLLQVLYRALTDQERGIAAAGLVIDDDCRQLIAHAAQGDARRLLNWLETLADMVATSSCKVVDQQLLKAVLGEQIMHYDKGGDAFYEQISAFHKSVRGSSTNGALYWLARMLQGGCDPLYVARRLLAIATEDIGMADPRAMQVTLNAWEIFERVGETEGNRALAQAAVYCACAPKSNALYKGFNQAMTTAAQTGDKPVPLHLRNAPTKLMANLGYGQGYRYDHDEPGAFAAGQTYLPDGVAGGFYEPTDRGLEQRIKNK